MSGARVQLDAGGTFTQNPQYTLFSRKYDTRDTYIAESFEVPFDTNVPEFGGFVSARIPPKGDLVRRLTVRSELPQLYTPLGPGYVYPQYSDAVDGQIYVQTNTLAIQPGDFVGYFNTQFLSAWATNFVGYSNLNVAYDSTLNKFVFTGVYSNIFFQNEGSASFWGFDIRSPDFFTASGYPAYNFTGGTLTAPLTLVQAGWIRGFTPPPSNGFSYVDSVATKLIKSATLTVGGQTIDRLTSERLYLEHDLGVAYENQAALTILEGKNDTSVVSTPREYYTKLTFNMDTLNMSELYRNDVRVDIEYEKFENLASNVITSNGFLDGASYVTSNLQAITADGTQNFDPTWAIGWKNYVIMGPLLNNSFRFYNQDDGTFYKWTPGSGTDAFITTNGGTLYGSTGGYLKKALISTILSSSTTPWTTSTYSFFSAFPANGDANGGIGPVITDARYAYIQYRANYFIIGSTYTSLVSGSLDGTQKIWTIVYRFYNKTAPLSASDQTALANFWTSYAGAFSSAVISSMNQDGSDVLVTGTLTYPVATPGDTPGLNVHKNAMWMRYDTTADFNLASSYTYALTSGGLPASYKDVYSTYNSLSLPNTAFYFFATFDGQYIYFPTAGSYVAKLDTQSFLSTSAYTQVNGSIISPNPVRFTDGPWISDGRYLYPASSSSRGSTGTFSRYDSTKSISQQASWEFYTGDTVIRANDFEASIPCGFDGKYIYYHTSTAIKYPLFPITDFSRKTLWHKYDTTKPFNSRSSWEWINFLINDDNTLAITGSDGSSPQITLLAHRSDLTTSSTAYNAAVRRMRFITGSRYIYITELDGRGFLLTEQDFIQYNPVTMSKVLSSSSIITKYEKYTAPPKTGKMLYGQTDVETFTIQPGAQTSEFQLRFINPVRELWISVDAPCVIRRLILRLNGEVLIDDDQVTTKTIRAFESHTYVSSNVAVVNFALDPETVAPSGSLNMSRIASPMLEIQLVNVPTATANVRVYSKSFNVFQGNNGIGGLLFNSAF